MENMIVIRTKTKVIKSKSKYRRVQVPTVILNMLGIDANAEEVFVTLYGNGLIKIATEIKEGVTN